MINPIIMQLQVEKATSVKERAELVIKIKRVYLELQQYANPYFKDGKDMKAEEIEQCGDELLKYKQQLIGLDEKISQIKSQLGE